MELLVSLGLIAVILLPMIILSNPKSGGLALGSTSRYKNITLTLSQKVMDETLSKLRENFSATDACNSPDAAAPCTRDNLCYNTNAATPCTQDEYKDYRYYKNIIETVSQGGVPSEMFVLQICVWYAKDTNVKYADGTYQPYPHSCIFSKVAKRD